MAGSNLFSRANIQVGSNQVDFALTDKDGLAYFGKCTGVPPTNANFFSPGCIMIRTDGTNGSVIYINVGSTAVPLWGLGGIENSYTVSTATIGTTGNATNYAIAPASGMLVGASFTDGSSLAASTSNYVSFTITNLGQNGTGTAAMLLATTTNTTKVTGLTIGATRALGLTTTSANLLVNAGDVLQITGSSNGTLAGTVTLPVYLLSFV